jgi:methanethiol S-methyltransferase
MKKSLILIYAGIAYVLAMANIAYIVAFLADFGVPWTVNSGGYGGEPWTAAVINALLVLGFGLHHSVTARPAFKRWWTRIIPPYLERATYLYMTAAMTAVLVGFWQPVPITIWHVQPFWAVAAIVSLYLGVWLMMFSATFHFGHFGFFGLAQAWRRVREREVTGTTFTARYLYAVVRHPISLGWMVAPWITPHMTVGQLVFALSATAYVLIATWFEEADLVAEFGDRYRRYRAEVPAFIPRVTRSDSGKAEASDHSVHP